MIFDVIFCILESSGGRLVSVFVAGRLCLFLICAILVKLTFSIC